MRIALVSWEYPPDTAFGGIATYVGQAAKMLAQRRHQVEVFTASPNREGTFNEDGVIVHRLKHNDHPTFSRDIAPLVLARHRADRFDVMEGPEFGADCADVMRQATDLPLVLKLHTPNFLIRQIEWLFVPFRKRLRIRLGAMRRGQRPVWVYQREADPEYQHSKDADEVAAPCQSIADMVGKAWSIPQAKTSIVPYPFVPSSGLLEIPATRRSREVLYMGRLELRKGVIDLARAIPRVLKRHPDATFRFIGSTKDSPIPGVNMKKHLQALLAPYARSVHFSDPVPMDQIPTVLASADVCVFPSIWENFPNVCLESMSAARATVGSVAGGMAEQLDNGSCGRLIRPQDPADIARAINELLDDEKLRVSLGDRARQRVLEQYNLDRISAFQEASYERAIRTHKSR